MSLRSALVIVAPLEGEPYYTAAGIPADQLDEASCRIFDDLRARDDRLWRAFAEMCEAIEEYKWPDDAATPDTKLESEGGP